MYRTTPVSTIQGLTRIEVVLPNQLCDGLQHAADACHTTPVEMLRRLIERELHRDRGGKSAGPRVSKALCKKGTAMTTPTFISEPVVGTPVFTRDGSKIGNVTAVEGTSFQVGGHWGRDYWLSQEIARPQANLVRLVVDHADVRVYKQHGPAPAMPKLDEAVGRRSRVTGKQ